MTAITAITAMDQALTCLKAAQKALSLTRGISGDTALWNAYGVAIQNLETAITDEKAKPDYCDMYMRFADAMEYTSGKDGLEFSPEEWAVKILEESKSYKQVEKVLNHNYSKNPLEGLHQVFNLLEACPLLGLIGDAIQELQAKELETSKTVAITKSTIREIFIGNGFKIQEGYTDLKDYVYQAAEELLTVADNRLTVSESLDAEEMVGAACYRGNTVSYSYDKLKAYGYTLDRAWKAMATMGYPADGNTDLSTMILKIKPAITVDTVDTVDTCACSTCGQSRPFPKTEGLWAYRHINYNHWTIVIVKGVEHGCLSCYPEGSACGPDDSIWWPSNVMWRKVIKGENMTDAKSKTDLAMSPINIAAGMGYA